MPQANAKPRTKKPSPNSRTRTTRHTTLSRIRNYLHIHILRRADSTSTTPSNMSAAVQSVQCFGKKKTATAVAHCKQGKGLVKVNGKPLSLVEPQILRFKVYEPLLILGLDKFGTSQMFWRKLEDIVAMGGEESIRWMEGPTSQDFGPNNWTVKGE